jgi:septal ring factor EnvC (AmiA/AmiB activator)
MQDLMIGIVAALLGVALGFWLRASSARADKEQVKQREDELKAIRVELDVARAKSDERAGFESLAGEREKTIAQLTAERDGLRADLQAKTETELNQAARISRLETQIAQDEKNLAEKLALLETAKQALSTKNRSPSPKAARRSWERC